MVKIIDRNQHVINIYRVVDVSRYVDLVLRLLEHFLEEYFYKNTCSLTRNS